MPKGIEQERMVSPFALSERVSSFRVGGVGDSLSLAPLLELSHQHPRPMTQPTTPDHLNSPVDNLMYDVEFD